MTLWAEKKVSDLIDGLAAGVSVRSRDGDVSRPAVLKTSAVANGRVDFRETKAIVAADVSRAKCAPIRDSIVISRMNTPALVGAVGYVETDEPGVFLPDRLWIARSKRAASTDMRWLNYALGFGDVATNVRELATGTSNSMKNIPKSRLLELVLLVPSPDEQRAISTALVDVDNLIASLERLIAKKREIKQGLMQELLTGRTRLQGFVQPWATRSLEEVGGFLKGRGIRRDEVKSSGVPCIRYGEIYTTFSNYTSSSVSYVSKAVAQTSLPIQYGDILFAASGETKEEIGMSVAYIGNEGAVAGGDIIVLRGNGYDPVFLATLLNTPSVASQKARSGQGDAVVHIHSRSLASLSVALPEIDEQHAIGAVLRDADDEIAALERRLKSARAIKQGMMQELLTGRTRLTEEVAA